MVNPLAVESQTRDCVLFEKGKGQDGSLARVNLEKDCVGRKAF